MVDDISRGTNISRKRFFNAAFAIGFAVQRTCNNSIPNSNNNCLPPPAVVVPSTIIKEATACSTTSGIHQDRDDYFHDDDIDNNRAAPDDEDDCPSYDDENPYWPEVVEDEEEEDDDDDEEQEEEEEQEEVVVDGSGGEEDDANQLDLEILPDIAEHLPFQTKNFSILSHVLSNGDEVYLGILREVQEKLLTDKLFEGSQHSLQDFGNEFMSILISGKVNYSTRQLLVNLWAKYFLQADGPHPIKLPFTRGKSGRYTFQTCCESSLISRFYQFGVCEEGCVVYEGIYKTYDKCPVCSKSRWWSDDLKKGSKKFQKATIFYRSLIARIKFLLSHHSFVRIISAGCGGNLGTTTRHNDDDSILSDLLHGDEPRRHLQEMHENFSRAAAHHHDGELIEISLLFGQFFDGAQIYKHTVKDFWPLCLTILNLPPALRHSPAIGIFLCALDPTKHGGDKTAIRNFLFRDCLIKELLFLNKGFTYKVGNDSYYVQARLILHCLDTMALCPMIQCQGPQSNAGCALCRKSGTTRRCGWKNKCRVVMIGHRENTPEDNITRNYGQSSHQCPEDFFSRAINKEDDDLASLFKNESSKPKFTTNRKREKVSSSFGENKLNFIKAICDGGAYYPFTERRKFKQHCRISNDQYIECGIEYLQKLQQSNRKKKLPEPVNGQYGLWHFAHLPYSDVERQLCWDPFHALKGLIAHLMANLRGKRINKYPKDMCKLTQCHVFLDNPAWVLKEKQLENLDAWMSAMIIPTGSRNEFDVANMVSNFFMKPGITQMKFIACIFPSLVLASSLQSNCRHRVTLEDYFIKFIILLSDVVCSLLSPVFEKEKLDDLHKQVLEFISMHEGVFPESESQFIVHELADIPMFIKEFGPVRGWWTLFGERLLSTLKSLRPKGGRSFAKHIWNRYMEFDADRLSTFLQTYDVNEIIVDDDAEATASTMSHFTYKLRKLVKNISEKEKVLRFFEFRHLMIFLLMEVEDHYKDLNEALKGSFLYRTYCHFLYCLSKKNSNLPTDFAMWVVAFHDEDYEADVEDDDYEKRKHLLEKDDIKTLFNQLRLLRTHHYARAIIGGIELRSRGWECREKHPTIVSRWGMEGAGAFFETANPLNDLKKHWMKKDHSSSWCKITTSVHKSYTEFNDYLSLKRFLPFKRMRGGATMKDLWNNWSVNRQTMFAQINSFVRISLPCDGFLDGYPIVSLVCRQASPKNSQQQYNYVPTSKGSSSSDVNIFYPFKLFANVRDIVPTRVACIGIDCRHSPIYPGSNNGGMKHRSHYSPAKTNDVEHLLLIELDKYWNPVYHRLVDLPGKDIEFEEADYSSSSLQVACN